LFDLGTAMNQVLLAADKAYQDGAVKTLPTTFYNGIVQANRSALAQNTTATIEYVRVTERFSEILGENLEISMNMTNLTILAGIQASTSQAGSLLGGTLEAAIIPDELELHAPINWKDRPPASTTTTGSP
jgi:hypothetical protein